MGPPAGISSSEKVVVKPFLYYNIAKNWDLMYIPYGITVYWNKESGQNIYVPLGGGVRRVFNLGEKTDLNFNFLSSSSFNDLK